MPILDFEGNIALVGEAIALSEIQECSRLSDFDSKNVAIKPKY